MAVRTLKIDQQDIAVESGASIIQAAQQAGVRIPQLCHLEGVNPGGGLPSLPVEVEGVNSCCPPV
jgi:bidirectional [NiFe] hydrogenase diaphorase subunit